MITSLRNAISYLVL
jgi:ent-copalyl diphosphate synthase